MRARLGNQIQHLCLQTRSGAGDDGPARVARMPIPVADYTAGGFDDWHQRLHIVCIQIHIQNDVDQSARKQTGAVTFGAVAHIARIAPHRAEGTAFRGFPNCAGSLTATDASASVAHVLQLSVVATLPRRHCARPGMQATNDSPT